MKLFFKKIDQFPKEWLLRVEIYELIHDKDNIDQKDNIKNQLTELAKDIKLTKLIKNGIELIESRIDF